MVFTVDSAKDFLLSKLLDQAAHDHVSLDDTEKSRFLYSEATGDTDSEAAKLFDAKYDERTYESKISRLLRRAYARDKKIAGETQEWHDALKTLSDEDFYGLVMVDQAGIPRSKALLWKALASTIPLDIAELAVIGLGFLIVFRPSILGLYLPNWVRWLAYPLFLWLVWYIGRIFTRSQLSKAMKRSKSTGN